jgi:hypothetical protein
MYKTKNPNMPTFFKPSEKESLCEDLATLADIAIEKASRDMKHGEDRFEGGIRQILFCASLINLYLERHTSSSAVTCKDIANNVFEIIKGSNVNDGFYQEITQTIEPYINSAPGPSAAMSLGS